MDDSVGEGTDVATSTFLDLDIDMPDTGDGGSPPSAGDPQTK